MTITSCYTKPSGRDVELVFFSTAGLSVHAHPPQLLFAHNLTQRMILNFKAVFIDIYIYLSPHYSSFSTLIAYSMFVTFCPTYIPLVNIRGSCGRLFTSGTWSYICKFRGAYDKFPDFFRMGTFIDSTLMKL